jgi:hypothetical protein
MAMSPDEGGGVGWGVTADFQFSKKPGLNFFWLQPPLVQMCNSTTAGLGYSEVVWTVLE